MKRKRLLGLLLSMSLVISMAMPGTVMAASGDAADSGMAYTEDADTSTSDAVAEKETGILLASEGSGEIATVTVTSEEELTKAITDASEPTRVIVANTIELTNTLTIAAGKDITLEGAADGISIKAGNTFTASTYRMVYLAGTLTLKNITLDANASASRLWRVLYMYTDSNCTMEDGAVITGGYTNKSGTSGYGGGVLVYTGSTLTMKDGSRITGNTVAYSSSTMGGGGVGIYGGTLDMQGGSIDGNTLKRGYGAGVYLYNAAAEFKMSGNATIASNSITGTTASYGGGVGVYRGTCEITGGSIVENTVATGNGSAIYNNQPGFILKNVTISGNAANNGTGAVYNTDVGTTVDFSIENVTITGNTATGTVAGLYNENATLSMGGKIVIADNLVGGTEKNLNFDLNTGNFITLTGALTEGSRIGLVPITSEDLSGYVCLSTVTLTEAELALAANTFYFENASASNGHGFSYNVASQSILWRVIDSSMFVTSAEVHNQQELENALKYASIDEKTTITLKNDIALTTGITVPANTDVTILSDPAAQTPYTVTADESTYTNPGNYSLLTVKGNLALANVTIDAAQKCRGIYADAFANLTLDTGAVVKNGAGINTNALDGLGIYMAEKSGTLVMKDGSKVTDSVNKTLNGNSTTSSDYSGTVPKGLGVYIGPGASFLMEGGEISNCLDYGYVSGQVRVEMYNCAVGGGVYCASDSVFEMTGGRISGNKVYGAGGGVYAGGKVTIGQNAEITANEVLMETQKVVSSVTHNEAGMCLGGGGIYAAGDVTISGEARIADNRTYISEIEDWAQSSTLRCAQVISSYKSCGGGILVASGTVIMNGGTISGNEAGMGAIKSSDNIDYSLSNGGGIYVKGGTFTMNGGSITGNRADSLWTENALAGNGGGICLGYTYSTGDYAADSLGTVILNSGTIKDNTSSGKGNDVYLTNQIKIAVSVGVNPGSSVKVARTIAGSPIFLIGSDTKNISVGELYLPSPVVDDYEMPGEAVITIGSALKEGAGSIGILTESSDIGTVVAKSGDSYALRNSDLDVGTLNYTGTDSEEKGMEINDDGYIVLGNKNTAQRTDLSIATVTVPDVSWSGYVRLPEVTVTLDGKVLNKGTDYVVRYSDNIELGTATVTVNGVGNYTGTAIGTFTIHPLDMNDESIEVEPIADKYYTGTAFTPAVTITRGGAALADKTDYSVSYSSNIAVGEATVTITGNGYYTGTRTITFKINAIPENGMLVTDEEKLAEALEKATGTAENPYKIVLANDISLNDMHPLAEGQHVEVCGNGYTLTAASAHYATADVTDTAMFTVPSGASLMLSDLALNGSYMERLVYVYAGASLNVSSDVTFTQGRVTDLSTSTDVGLGGQVIWNAGTVNFAGSISGNSTIGTTRRNYYGVIYNSGTFVMKEGSLLYSIQAYTYGAVYNDVGGSFCMEGGIINAVLTPFTSGDIGIYNRGDFTMSGGEISGNKGSSSTIYNYGTFTMTGGKISNNTNSSTSGGTGVIYNSKNFIMTGGEISYNQTYGKGGAIYMVNGTFTIDGADARIEHNKAVFDGNVSPNTNPGGNSIGGGVFLSAGTLELRNGSISNNTAYHLYNTGVKAAQNVTVKNPNDTSQTDPYGVGGGIVITGGTFKMSGGTVSGNTAPGAVQTSGIYVDNGIISTKTTAQLEISGDADIQDTIYLATDKNITITGPLSDDVSYTVYQQQADFALMENTGKPVAVYASLTDEEGNVVSEEFLNRLDGEKFHPYAYDPKEDYEADPSLVYVVDEENRQIVPAKSYPLEECEFVFSDADSVETDPETGEVTGYIYNYTGKPMDVGQMNITATAPDGSAINTADLNYEIEEGADTINAGEVKVKVTSNRGIYTGEAEISFRIGGIDLTDVYDAETNETGLVHHTTVTVGDTCVGQEPEISVAIRLKSSLREETLVRDKDYTVTYENLYKTGTAAAIIEGIGNYKGTLTEEFAVAPKELTVSDITLEAASFMYDGTAKTPKVTVTNGELVLEEDTDYTVSYANNIKIGTATVTGIENYTGTVEILFTIKTEPKWIQNAKGWWYQYEDGTYPANCWALISNKWYHFNASGYMQTGWQYINNKWYYLGGANDGAMKTGWQQVNGKWYYLGASNDGAMKTGWQKVKGKWYYMNSNGVMQTGWVQVNGKWYYMNSNGVMQTGWLKSGSNWYYLNSSGAMVTSTWVGNYYLKSNGVMARSEWVDNGRYYVDQNGVWVPGK